MFLVMQEAKNLGCLFCRLAGGSWFLFLVFILTLALFSFRLAPVGLLCGPWSKLSQGTKFMEIFVSNLGPVDLLSEMNNQSGWVPILSVISPTCLVSPPFFLQNRKFPPASDSSFSKSSRMWGRSRGRGGGRGSDNISLLQTLLTRKSSL